MKILLYLLEGQPKLTLINYLRKTGITYPKTIKLSLNKCASNEKLLKTVDKINNFSQPPNQRASDFAHYVRSRTNRCYYAYGPIH